MTDVVSRLRARTVPKGYSYHMWKPSMCIVYETYYCNAAHVYIAFTGQSESFTDMLRSILAQLEFCYEVHQWDSPFRQHTYVPEIHSKTVATYHKREDEAHVLKVQVYCID